MALAHVNQSLLTWFFLFLVVDTTLYEDISSISHNLNRKIKNAATLVTHKYEGDINFVRNDAKNHRETIWVVLEKMGIRSHCDFAHLTYKKDDEVHQQLQLVLGSTLYADTVTLADYTYHTLVLWQWLRQNDILVAPEQLYFFPVNSLKDLEVLDMRQANQIFANVLSSIDIERLKSATVMLQQESTNRESLEAYMWASSQCYKLEQATWTFGEVIMTILTLLVLGILSEYYSKSTKQLHIYDLVLGNYLSVKSCNVSWNWTDPSTVGGSYDFTVHFRSLNRRCYALSPNDHMVIEVTCGSNQIPVSLHLPDAGRHGVAHCSFTAQTAGLYVISVMINALHIGGSPFNRTFRPGEVDSSKSRFVGQSCIVVCTAGKPHPMIIELCDQYGNICDYRQQQSKHHTNNYSIKLNKSGTSEAATPTLDTVYETSSHRLILKLIVHDEGCYDAAALYDGQPIGNGHFTLIALSEVDAETMFHAVGKKNSWFEARQLKYDPEREAKSRKVYCYISPKQLTVKEYFLKCIPKRLYTFRVCPSTKITFLRCTDDTRGAPEFTIDDGNQHVVHLMSAERNVIGACFASFLIKNIGGSDSFTDKVAYFHNEIRKLYKAKSRGQVHIKVKRHDLLASSYRATKSLTTSQWTKQFYVEFQGEQGLDYGGVSREWIDQLCRFIFDPLASGLFCSFDDSSQGLAHPSKAVPAPFSYKHYEFAGKLVGKCMYESSLGTEYQRLVTARFTRSFLAQLIGLRVTYKYFEHDDPQLYISKVKYILENDIDDMDMYFTEEEYKGYHLDAVVDLVPNGSHKRVTNSNKLQYLNALAHYKLCTNAKVAVTAFLKGLNELIPDDLLSIFDENELELLICGTGNYSLADFRSHHVVSGWMNKQVLEWFWTAVSGFTQEEFGRLLQFTTGCSQLPPGGFAQLVPLFKISSTLTFGNLPTAHTCFHQLCLPTYFTYEEFRQSLMLAITEGAQGFGLV